MKEFSNRFLIVLCFFITVREGIAQEGYKYPSLIEVNPPDGPPSGSTKAIVGVRLIDGLGGEVIEDAVVVIEGNRIKYAGPKSRVQIPEGAEITEAKGMSLLPGLIDAHLHSTNNNRLIHTFLKNGVTTMRDPGHPFRFYQSLDFAKEKMPRVYLTGAHLDGYPGVYVQQANFIKSMGHISEVLNEYVKEGATGIKIYFRLPLKYFESLIQTADFYHIPVVAHLELVAADDAIRAGLKGVEHVTSFGTSLADPKDAREFREAVDAENEYRRDGRYLLWSKIDLNSNRVKEVIELAARENVIISPTLATFERQAEDKEVTDYQAKGFENMLKFVGMAHQAGVTMVTGSHTSGKYAKSGWAYQREMELLVKAGMTPLEAISSSTIHNARYFRTDQRLGSIEPGKLADLVLVGGDPTVDITRMYDIQKVMLNGEWVDGTTRVE